MEAQRVIERESLIHQAPLTRWRQNATVEPWSLSTPHPRRCRREVGRRRRSRRTLRWPMFVPSFARPLVARAIGPLSAILPPCFGSAEFTAIFTVPATRRRRFRARPKAFCGPGSIALATFKWRTLTAIAPEGALRRARAFGKFTPALKWARAIFLVIAATATRHGAGFVLAPAHPALRPFVARAVPIRDASSARALRTRAARPGIHDARRSPDAQSVRAYGDRTPRLAGRLHRGRRDRSGDAPQNDRIYRLLSRTLALRGDHDPTLRAPGVPPGGARFARALRNTCQTHAAEQTAAHANPGCRRDGPRKCRRAHPAETAGSTGNRKRELRAQCISK